MSRENIHNQIHFYLAIIIALTLPFVKITPVFIVLMVVNWLFEGGLRFKWRQFLENKLALLFVSLYLIHIIGLLYTQNMNAGSFDLQVKLSLLAFPILLSGKPLTPANKSAVFTAFIIGSIAVSIYLLARASYMYYTTGENNFFYINFSSFVHPSYLSMYIDFAIVILIANIFSSNKILPKVSSFMAILLICFFIMMVLFLLSKSGIITLILIITGAIAYSIFVLKKYWIGIFTVTCVIGLVIAINKTDNPVLLRLTQFAEAIISYNPVDEDTIDSTKIRLRVWESASNVIKENFWIGVGNGDAKEELMKDYERRGLEYIYASNLNAHNEFFQVFVGLGFIGFVILLTSMFVPLVYALKSNNYLYVLFLLIIVFNFCFESMLETQAGTMFYAFFNSLLCFEKKHES